MALRKKNNMLTSGNESREFLYADDCSEGLCKMMTKYKFFFENEKRTSYYNIKKN